MHSGTFLYQTSLPENCPATDMSILPPKETANLGFLESQQKERSLGSWLIDFQKEFKEFSSHKSVQTAVTTSESALTRFHTLFAPQVKVLLQAFIEDRSILSFGIHVTLQKLNAVLDKAGSSHSQTFGKNTVVAELGKLSVHDLTVKLLTWDKNLKSQFRFAADAKNLLTETEKLINKLKDKFPSAYHLAVTEWKAVKVTQTSGATKVKVVAKKPQKRVIKKEGEATPESDGEATNDEIDEEEAAADETASAPGKPAAAQVPEVKIDENMFKLADEFEPKKDHYGDDNGAAESPAEEPKPVEIKIAEVLTPTPEDRAFPSELAYASVSHLPNPASNPSSFPGLPLCRSSLFSSAAASPFPPFCKKPDLIGFVGCHE
jgi:hypothetical protein